MKNISGISYRQLADFVVKEPIEKVETIFKRFGDLGKIGLVLGGNFVFEKQEEKKDFAFARFTGYDDDIITDLKQRKVYGFTNPEDWNAEKFISIYSNNIEKTDS